MNTVSSRSLARRPVLVAATFIAGSTALLLSACGGSHPAGAEPTGINSTDIPNMPDTGVPTSAAPTSAAPTSAAPVDGCPVSASTLLAALRAWPSYSSLEPTSQLTNVQCYQGYAMARTTAVHTDSAHVVFRYDASSAAWKTIAGGTDGFCADVPADIQPHLTGC
jgi:hypothetical protein